MDLANPKQTRPTLGSYLSDQTFVFTTRLIKRLPSLYCFRGRGGGGRAETGRKGFSLVWMCLRISADANDDSCVEYGALRNECIGFCEIRSSIKGNDDVSSIFK